MVVTAYAVGLEDFDDKNGNNVFDAGDIFIDSNAKPKIDHDLPDAYVDANKDGKPGSGDPAVFPLFPTFTNPTINGDTDILIPYQNNTTYSYRGDGIRGTAHIRASTVIYLGLASTAGDPTVILPIDQLSQERDLVSGDLSSPFLRLTPSCPDGVPVPQATLSMVLEDGIGNPMAALTSLAVADNSDNIAPAGFRPSVVLAFGARPPSPFTDLPNIPKLQRDSSGLADPYLLAASNSPAVGLARNGTVSTGHSVTVRGVKDKCSGNASFALEVASPRGGKASTRILYDGESRARSRFAFDVRYRNPIAFTLITDQTNSLKVNINQASWVGDADAIKYTVFWGDGTFTTGTGAVVPSKLSHEYLKKDKYSVSVRFERGGWPEETSKVFDLSNFSLSISIGPDLPADAPDFLLPKQPTIEIDWGDGSGPKPVKFSDGKILAVDRSKEFTTLGAKSISLKITTVTGTHTKIDTGSQVVTLK